MLCGRDMALPFDLPDLDRLGRAPRLALAYAPTSRRALVAALLVLDEQFAGFVRNASEPVLAQMRLAWWRDRFAQDPSDWPQGNPLLAQFADLGLEARHLGGVVDGWEHVLDERPLGEDQIAAHARGRASGWAALANHFDHPESAPAAERAAMRWTLVDFAWHIAEEEERGTALAAARTLARAVKLPRALRTAGVLGGLAARSLETGRPPLSRASDMTAALRIGLFGR